MAIDLESMIAIRTASNVRSRVHDCWSAPPKLHPALLRLSAVLLIVVDDLRGRFARFELGAHLLGLFLELG